MESELSRVVDAHPGSVWTALLDGQIDYPNQRWCQYTGLSLEEASRSGWQSAIFPADLPHCFMLPSHLAPSGSEVLP
jgi:PAS domain-containing protein